VAADGLIAENARVSDPILDGAVDLTLSRRAWYWIASAVVAAATSG